MFALVLSRPSADVRLLASARVARASPARAFDDLFRKCERVFFFAAGLAAFISMHTHTHTLGLLSGAQRIELPFGGKRLSGFNRGLIHPRCSCALVCEWVCG